MPNNSLFFQLPSDTDTIVTYNSLRPVSIKNKVTSSDTIMSEIIKIDKNGKVDFNFNFKKQSQVIIFQDLMKKDFNEAINYLKSFKGVKIRDKNSIIVSKSNSQDCSIDALANKISSQNLNVQRASFNSAVEHNPLPINEGTWIGVEIECLIPIQSLNNQLSLNGLNHIEKSVQIDNCDCGGNDEDGSSCDGHEYDSDDEDGRENFFDNCHRALRRIANSRKLKRVTVKSDGSLKHEKGCFPVEFNIIFTQRDRKPLEDLCKFLKDLNAKVNYSCGLHVHFDQRNLVNEKTGTKDLISLRTKGRKLRYAMPILAEMIPYSRRNNRYCIQKVSRIDGDRYSAVNMTAFEKYRTLEVRLHSGTTVYKKINNWIDILLAIMESKTLKRKCFNVDELFEAVDFKKDLKEYMISRIKLFKAPLQQEAV